MSGRPSQKRSRSPSAEAVLRGSFNRQAVRRAINRFNAREEAAARLAAVQAEEANRGAYVAPAFAASRTQPVVAPSSVPSAVPVMPRLSRTAQPKAPAQPPSAVRLAELEAPLISLGQLQRLRSAVSESVAEALAGIPNRRAANVAGLAVNAGFSDFSAEVLRIAAQARHGEESGSE